MGSFSIWHWLILLLVLALAAGIVGLVVWLGVCASRALGKRSGGGESAQERLRQLDDVKAQGLITEDEYARQRAVIVRSI